MLQFHYQPPIPARATKESFVQTVQLKDDQKVIGVARWFAPVEASEGVVQLLELRVAPEFRRQGHGHRLLQEVVAQALEHQRVRKAPLRRMWVNVEQKSQVIARAFLTQHSFHHVATAKEMLKDQDALIYLRSFD